MEKPSRGGEKRTAVWASPHEERGSDGAVDPPMCDHRVVLHRCVVREWCNPSGATVATCLHAAARARRAERAVDGGVANVPQALHVSPSAPPIHAQRVARFDDYCTRNCLLKNKLRQRYSRFMYRQKRAVPEGPEGSEAGKATHLCVERAPWEGLARRCAGLMGCLVLRGVGACNSPAEPGDAARRAASRRGSGRGGGHRRAGTRGDTDRRCSWFRWHSPYESHRRALGPR